MRLAVGYVWTQIQTTKHKLWVAWYLGRFAWELAKRALSHDLSKYRWDEAGGFARTIFDMKHVEYGTDDYRALLRAIAPNIKRHYQRNTHHPEFWSDAGDGFRHMGILDRVEMVADWIAASRRTKNGSVWKSLPIQQERFGYDDRAALELAGIATVMHRRRPIYERSA